MASLKWTRGTVAAAGLALAGAGLLGHSVGGIASIRTQLDDVAPVARQHVLKTRLVVREDGCPHPAPGRDTPPPEV